MTVVRVSEQTRRIKQLEAEVEQLRKENRQLREDTTPVGFLDREERIEQAAEAIHAERAKPFGPGEWRGSSDWDDASHELKEDIRRYARAAVGALESSPAPDEVVVRLTREEAEATCWDRRSQRTGASMTGQIVPGGIMAASFIFGVLGVLWWGK